ncbi:uncharacterized protein EV420DRAFT_127413 [Desarmillaria tabescens]|uniref:F-box domain-containing protein n=1 Tax=Armillaria tabescens TaxID=1929756 RepID=A0AA39TJY9_ARMTA|nr:uncharacterized protein EV420DRAFT_127413 [Desarmillaria tabescens]KAK0461772.1 hypothetical protein EV420DRAFT_127413 [Desarmillaria tabescens]
MDSLPQELLDVIVDKLSQDRESLCALHSVSRSFKSRVQGHLFRSIRLPDESHFHSFLELCTTSPNILDLVRELQVTVSINPLSQHDASQALANRSLPNLRSLHIYGGRSINPRHPSRVNMHGIPPTLLTYPITSLTLENLNISSARHLRDILRSFPALQTLVMNQVRVCVSKPSAPGPVSEATEPEQSGPLIENLSISFSISNLCDVNTLLKADGKPFVLRRLRKLSYSWLRNWHGIRDLQLLLPETRGTLQELRLRHKNVIYGKRHGSGDIVDFSQVPCVIFEPPWDSDYQIIGLEWFAECLKPQGDGPARISQLCLSLHVLDFEDLSNSYKLVCCSLDRALAAQRFVSLKNFDISIVAVDHQLEDQPNWPELELAILSAFPILHEQKKVTVQIAAP